VVFTQRIKPPFPLGETRAVAQLVKGLTPQVRRLPQAFRTLNIRTELQCVHRVWTFCYIDFGWLVRREQNLTVAVSMPRIKNA
jgi:hypothetical protein